jgi:hypothetical protein
VPGALLLRGIGMLLHMGAQGGPVYSSWAGGAGTPVGYPLQPLGPAVHTGPARLKPPRPFGFAAPALHKRDHAFP